MLPSITNGKQFPTDGQGCLRYRLKELSILGKTSYIQYLKEIRDYLEEDFQELSRYSRDARNASVQQTGSFWKWQSGAEPVSNTKANKTKTNHSEDKYIQKQIKLTVRLSDIVIKQRGTRKQKQKVSSKLNTSKFNWLFILFIFCTISEFLSGSSSHSPMFSLL